MEKSPPSVDVTGLTCHYGGHLAVDAIDLHIPAGVVTALVGHNGSGKSTVLMALAGLLRPSAGAIAGRPADIAFVPQHSSAPDHLPITVRQTVEMGRWRTTGPFGRLSRRDRRIVDDCLERLHISDLADRRLGGLSGGQRQRTLVAQGLAQKAPLLLLDEPLAGVDSQAVALIGRAIGGVRSEGTTIVLATHDQAQADSADQVVRLRQGSVAEVRTRGREGGSEALTQHRRLLR
ncbi:zinc ABC transporter ATP-binding protein AztA [Brevibacterium sp. CFH 10365]|uniref:zinc ABC transporter ATP-binding protein AztA n=1 Tax=Brevibacterium sp. CFH 10365 TaxID=2585207 RepID=UPI0012662811|nr:zinc ABC transporter ATP-binding protein AztA [Brevibacterium sp. CFH 10365]